MKKVLTNQGNAPPLVRVSMCDSQPSVVKPVNPVQSVVFQPQEVMNSAPPNASHPPYLLQTNSTATNNNNNQSAVNKNLPSMHLVQTTDGKKILLTNVVNITKRHGLPSKHDTQQRKLLILPFNKDSSSNPISSSLMTPAPVPSLVKTVPSPVIEASGPDVVAPSSTVTTPTTAVQPIVIQTSQKPEKTVIVSKGLAPPLTNRSQMINNIPKIITAMSGRTLPTTTTAMAVTTPVITSAPSSNAVMVLKTRTPAGKLVGSHVPVNVFSKLTKIAPKGQIGPKIPIPPLRSGISAAPSHIDPPVKPEPVVRISVGGQMKDKPLTKPPAYLNIKIKEDSAMQKDQQASLLNGPVSAENNTLVKEAVSAENNSLDENKSGDETVENNNSSVSNELMPVENYASVRNKPVPVGKSGSVNSEPTLGAGNTNEGNLFGSGEGAELEHSTKSDTAAVPLNFSSFSKLVINRGVVLQSSGLTENVPLASGVKSNVIQLVHQSTAGIKMRIGNSTEVRNESINEENGNPTKESDESVNVTELSKLMLGKFKAQYLEANPKKRSKVTKRKMKIQSPLQQANLNKEAVKEEVQVKQEPEDLYMGDKFPTLLDVRIKEEPTEEQSALLAEDEQLREVLGVSQNLQLTTAPRFYIRTSEGKLVSISPREAEALGLRYHDKVENNQKRLINALKNFKQSQPDQQNELDLFKAMQYTNVEDHVIKAKNTVLIPPDVNVQNFVSCHVSPEAEKNAAMMKKFYNQRIKASPKSSLSSLNNTAIIGKFTVNGLHYLRIKIHLDDGTSNECNILITPFNTYRCPFCSRDFRTKDYVISHIRIHTGERPYPCDVCGKRYRQRIDIIRHMRIHTGERPYTCAFCNATFNQKSNLRSHMRVHTGERPVQCKVCGRDFSRNTHLKQHMKLHTGEKPYTCTTCGRPFRFKSGLQAHERTHTGLKPYACRLCGRSFTQIVGLIRHERTHAVEKAFRCQSCGKSFNDREILKLHILKHTSMRPYPCDQCNKSFTDPSALRCHQKKYHSNYIMCPICYSEEFKNRIELREHLRAHERENWQETEDGDLIPIAQEEDTFQYVNVDDSPEDRYYSKLMEDTENNQTAPMEGENDEDDLQLQYDLANNGAEDIQVEVELDPDDPMLDDEEEIVEEEPEQQQEQADPLAVL